MPIGSELVFLPGQTGSQPRTVRTTRLMRVGRPPRLVLEMPSAAAVTSIQWADADFVGIVNTI
jgi:hypothetical protein